MGPLLIKRLLKELQSSIGFYEVQTGQSVGQLVSTQLSPKLAWLDTAIATALGISSLKPDAAPWLQSRQITLPEGPFGEFTGYYAGGQSEQPVIRVQRIYHRNDPILCAPMHRPVVEHATGLAAQQAVLGAALGNPADAGWGAVLSWGWRNPP